MQYGTGQRCKSNFAQDLIPNGALANDAVTPLISACLGGSADAVKALIAAEAEPNVATFDGRTPLMAACSNGCAVMVETLLNAGANPNAQLESNGASALIISAVMGNTAVVTALLQGGADPNLARTADKTSPLLLAAHAGNGLIVRNLMQFGADPRQENQDGATALTMAAFGGHLGCVRFLLRQGLRPDGARDSGKQPRVGKALMGAACNGHLEMVMLLVAVGADRDVSVCSTTALQLAEAKGHSNVAGWLRAVSGWSTLRVALACRMHREFTSALQFGWVDPDDCSSHAIATAAASQASFAEWASLPIGPIPMCEATKMLAVDALSGWSPRRHHLHAPRFRRAVKSVLLVAQRLQQTQRQSRRTKEEVPEEVETQEVGVNGVNGVPLTIQIPLPHLPSEIWIFLMNFLVRRDFR